MKNVYNLRRHASGLKLTKLAAFLLLIVLIGSMWGRCRVDVGSMWGEEEEEEGKYQNCGGGNKKIEEGK